MKSSCFSSKFDLLSYGVFLGFDPNERQSLHTLSIIYIKCLGEKKVTYYRTLRSSLGWKMGKRCISSFSYESAQDIVKDPFMVIIIKSVKKPCPHLFSFFGDTEMTTPGVKLPNLNPWKALGTTSFYYRIK